jgi:hypothetical protein
LEKNKEDYAFKNAKSEFEKRLILIEKNYKKLNINEKYIFIEEDIKRIYLDIDKKINTKEIENEIKNLEEEILQIKRSQEIIDNEEEDKISQILTIRNKKDPSINAQILYNYSKLFSLIDEFKNISNPILFLNRVDKFEELIKIDIINAYKEKIFSECKNNLNVTKKTIDLFKHLANSFLISNIVKKDFE